MRGVLPPRVLCPTVPVPSSPSTHLHPHHASQNPARGPRWERPGNQFVFVSLVVGACLLLWWVTVALRLSSPPTPPPLVWSGLDWSLTVNIGEGTDCPVFDGMYDYCSLYTGASLGQY